MMIINSTAELRRTFLFLFPTFVFSRLLCVSASLLSPRTISDGFSVITTPYLSERIILGINVFSFGNTGVFPVWTLSRFHRAELAQGFHTVTVVGPEPTGLCFPIRTHGFYKDGTVTQFTCPAF